MSPRVFGKRTLWSVAMLLVCFAWPSTTAPALGQTRNGARPSRFQPSRPTVSPYLNLFRSDRGTVPNYHLYVRPLQQQRALNNRVQEQGVAQDQAVRQLGEQISQIRAASTSPTGIGAGFGNYLQYYPNYKGLGR